MSIDLNALLNLEPLEKLRIIAALEDSLSSSGPVRLTVEQREEVLRRKREHEADPGSAVDWETLDRFLEADDD